MRLLFILVSLTFSAGLFSQNNQLIEMVFKDKSNFKITTYFGNKKPPTFFVLDATNKWSTYRFHLDEDLTLDSVRKSLEMDEHSPYNHSYLFRDPFYDRLFSETEKKRLFEKSLVIKPRQLNESFKSFKLIKSFESAKNGFFFSITDPIFTADNKYAFIDITTFKKDDQTEERRFAYFGHTLLIYKSANGMSWTRIDRIDYLIL